MKPFTFEDTTFTTQKALTEECRRILWHHRPGDVLGARDAAFMALLIERHPEYEMKRGVGIDSFFIMPDTFGKQCFAIRRIDATEVDFSFSSCIKAKPANFDFLDASRRAVAGQIIEFKRAAFAAAAELSCPITGRIVTSAICHVDHTPPDTFRAILDSFVASTGLDISTVKVGEANMEMRIEDDVLRSAWQEYHRGRAVLRIVSAEANLSHIRKKPR